MKKVFGNFVMCLIVATTMFAGNCNAATAPRKTATTKTTANAAAAARAPTKSTSRAPVTSAPKVTATKSEPEPEPVATPEPEPIEETPIVVDNKTSVFQDVMSEIGASSTDASENELAETIRRQRALLDGAGATTSTTTGGGGNMGSAAACDTTLRQCMTEKCGTGFTKCANDSTAVWGQKIESCRAKTKCTGHEYSLLAPEILADRDMNVRMAHYNSVINCGNKYNDCIFTQCGTTLNKCLAKKDGDNAVSKCASIANECKSMDNGLSARVMNVFGDLRKTATAQATRDEARLVELRKLMREQCNRFGAMFDERTLDCVYTVNFFAGEDNTLMASKKLYSGDAFQCNANWFGIDITTFKENAYRLTRSQKSASAAALGAGVGTAAGMLSSGAIGRAIDTAKARSAVKEAEDCSATLRSTTHVKSAKYDANGNCIVICRDKYKKTDDGLECVPTAEQSYKIEQQQGRRNILTNGVVKVANTATQGVGDTTNIVATGAMALLSPEASLTMANATGEVAKAKYNPYIESASLYELQSGAPGLHQMGNSLPKSDSQFNVLNGYEGMGNQTTTNNNNGNQGNPGIGSRVKQYLQNTFTEDPNPFGGQNTASQSQEKATRQEAQQFINDLTTGITSTGI